MLYATLALLASSLLFGPLFHGVAQAQAKRSEPIEFVANIGHTGPILSVAVSRDGSLIASAGSNGTVKIWSASTARLIRTLVIDGHRDDPINSVFSVAFSPSGHEIVAATSENLLRLWDLVSGKLLRVFSGHEFDIEFRTGYVFSVVFSPDGKRLVSSATDRTVRVWDVATAKPLRVLESSAVAGSVAVSADGSLIAAGCEDGNIWLWGSTSEPRRIGASGAYGRGVTRIAFSPDGSQIVSASENSSIVLWDVATGEKRKAITGEHGEMNSKLMPLAVAFSPDGRHVAASGKDNAVRLWSAATGDLLHTFEDPVAAIRSIAFSPEGDWLVAGGGDRTLRLWSIADKRSLRVIGAGSGMIRAVAVTPDGRRVITGTADGVPAIWDLTQGTLVQKLARHTEPVTAIALAKNAIISGSGKTVALTFGDLAHGLQASDSGALRLWDDKGAFREFEAPADVTPPTIVSSMALSPDGKLLVTGNAYLTVKVWNVETRRLINSFDAHTYSIDWQHGVAVAFAPDSATITTAAADIKQWHAESGQLIRTIFERGQGKVNALAYSSSGKLLASAHDRGWTTDDFAHARLWDGASGTLLTELNGHTAPVLAVAFSPDDSFVGTGSADRTVRIWSSATGKLVRTLGGRTPDAPHGHAGDVTAVAFVAGGTRLVSGSTDGTVKVWDVESGALLVTLTGGDDGSWLAITPDGFFAGPASIGNGLSIVRGLDVYAVEHFFEHLYRPDLLGELLKPNSDAEGKYAKAASELSLYRILGSGPAPKVTRIEERAEVLGSAVRVRVRIQDQGGGIGRRVKWRVNGQARADAEAPEPKADGENQVVVSQLLKVVPGEVHTVEVVAYNKEGLLASLPATFPISIEGAASRTTRMHVLAVGITGYDRADWRLAQAAGDATAFADAMETVGKGLFSKIKKRVITDGEATARNIEAAFKEIARDPELMPNDMFVLFLAGHGRYDGARYYFIPKDLDTDPPPTGKGHTIRQHGVNQDDLMRWIAGIQVNKRLVIIDTCESADGAGAVIRALASPRLTAMEQLQHATGDNLIAAAGQVAFESSKLGHGLLTYAVLDAFRAEGSGADEVKVTTDDVARHAVERVPALSREIFGQEQWPVRKLSAGIPIPLGFRRLQMREPAIPAAVHKGYVLMQAADVRTQPDASALTDPPIRLEAPMIVNILGFDDKKAWARVQWGVDGGGAGVGWVPAGAVQAPKTSPK